MVCPKCGSEKIMHDQCLRCGVIISKAKTGGSGPAPLSYVSPEAVPEPKQVSSGYEWRAPTIQQKPQDFETKKKPFGDKGKIVKLVIFLALSAITYWVYDYFMHQASAYSGYYKNMKHLFALHFPEKGWYHYLPKDIGNDAFKNAQDAFYSGRSRRNPDILMIVWVEGMPHPIPDRLDEESAGKVMQVLKQEFQNRMKKAGMDCEVTQTGRMRIGGNDGFFLRANLKDKNTQVKTLLYCAYNNRNAYTVQFIGNAKKILEREDEIHGMISSFSFRMSVI